MAAEISEATGPPKDDSQTDERSSAIVSDYNADTMRKTKPGLKRLILTLTVLLSFFLGAPFLMKSIEIYRSALPFREIDTLANEIGLTSLLFPCQFRAVFVGFDHQTHAEFQAEKLELSITDKLKTFSAINDVECGTCLKNYNVSVTVEPDFSVFGLDGYLEDDDNDDTVDELLESVLVSSLDSGRQIYTVVVMKKDKETKAVIGKHRHGWVIGRVSEVEAVHWVAETFVKIFDNGGKEEGSIHGEFMPVGADGRLILSFNLLNSDPRDWIFDWDFQKIDEILVAPIIEALQPVANISVESQVLYHTPKSSFSHWDNKLSSFVFGTKDLPFFVNSNEWHLDTSIAAGGRSKILQFVVYIPSTKECPLLLMLPNGDISETNGYISPMWGGVIVLNPPSCSNSGGRHPFRHTISSQDIRNVFEVFMGQFRQLLGLKSDNLYVGRSGSFKFLTSERGFAEWELDVLSRRHTCFNLLSCARTLGSLSRLVQSLPRMIIMDEIGKQVKLSLEAAKLAQNNASLGIYEASAVTSRLARALAEDAFFHPSIMSVSYYSFEHCFAVYSPFFMPVSLHVVLAAVREWRRYKQEKKKYLAWKAKEKAF